MQFGFLQLPTLKIGKVDIMWRPCFFFSAESKTKIWCLEIVTLSILTTPETHQLSEAKKPFEWSCDD